MTGGGLLFGTCWRFGDFQEDIQGVPHQIRPSMGLNCDLGDKSENLRRMNHLEKFNKANKKFVLQKLLDFSSIMCIFRR